MREGAEVVSQRRDASFLVKRCRQIVIDSVDVMRLLPSLSASEREIDAEMSTVRCSAIQTSN